MGDWYAAILSIESISTRLKGLDCRKKRKQNSWHFLGVMYDSLRHDTLHHVIFIARRPKYLAKRRSHWQVGFCSENTKIMKV